MTKMIRVRALLSSMDAPSRASLKTFLPKTTFPDSETLRYPSALLSVLPKENSYSLLGFIAEEMLRFPVEDIHIANLLQATKKWFPQISPQAETKIKKSKTTKPFLDHLRSTREKLDKVLQGTLAFDTTVTCGNIEGHPDAQSPTQIFEVKMTGQLKKNWIQFLYQVFAYAALDLSANEVFLVLPMQDLVWKFDLSKWTKRTEFRNCLTKAAGSEQPVDLISRQMIQYSYNIGNHVHKGKSIATTIRELSTLHAAPFQLFLGSSLSARLHIADEEIAQSAQEMAKTTLQLFVHSQYIINLCAEPGEKDDYATQLLIKNLQIASAIGLKGVVVHVGKSVKREKAIAEENMRKNLTKAMEHATPDCPILLETPAGQGTEMLTTYEEFVGFVAKFEDPRIRICVDTCHVYASGQQPLDYLTRLTREQPALLKLVHYNDSATPCGSCLDRHAHFGTGHIGMETMLQIAEHCKTHKYPMVIE